LTAWFCSVAPWVAIVDKADALTLAAGWGVQMRGTDPSCLSKRISGKTERLHRVLIGAPPGYVIDHVNGNPLDNRRVNLRVATVSQNAKNRRAQRGSFGRYKGVHAHNNGWWRAVIWSDGKRHSIGVYRTREEAAAAYDEAAIQLHGEFARTNSPQAAHSPSGFEKLGRAS